MVLAEFEPKLIKIRQEMHSRPFPKIYFTLNEDRKTFSLHRCLRTLKGPAFLVHKNRI